MTIDINQDMHKKLKHIAVEEGRSVRDLVLDAIDKTFIKDKPNNNIATRP